MVVAVTEVVMAVDSMVRAVTVVAATEAEVMAAAAGSAAGLEEAKQAAVVRVADCRAAEMALAVLEAARVAGAVVEELQVAMEEYAVATDVTAAEVVARATGGAAAVISVASLVMAAAVKVTEEVEYREAEDAQEEVQALALMGMVVADPEAWAGWVAMVGEWVGLAVKVAMIRHKQPSHTQYRDTDMLPPCMGLPASFALGQSERVWVP